MLEEIKRELGANYQETNDKVLVDIINDVTSNALSISNNRLENLKPEIKSCVKAIYLQRGAESVSSLSESGISSNYVDAYEKLRNDIIKNGKRLWK